MKIVEPTEESGIKSIGEITSFGEWKEEIPDGVTVNHLSSHDGMTTPTSMAR